MKVVHTLTTPFTHAVRHLRELGCKTFDELLHPSTEQLESVVALASKVSSDNVRLTRTLVTRLMSWSSAWSGVSKATLNFCSRHTRRAKQPKYDSLYPIGDLAKGVQKLYQQCEKEKFLHRGRCRLHALITVRMALAGRTTDVVGAKPEFRRISQTILGINICRKGRTHFRWEPLACCKVKYLCPVRSLKNYITCMQHWKYWNPNAATLWQHIGGGHRGATVGRRVLGGEATQFLRDYCGLPKQYTSASIRHVVATTWACSGKVSPLAVCARGDWSSFSTFLTFYSRPSLNSDLSGVLHDMASLDELAVPDQAGDMSGISLSQALTTICTGAETAAPVSNH